MRVYFVRHGESEENKSNVYGDEHSKLTLAGHEQARFVAERFTHIPIDLILSSDMERAQKTAQAISEAVGQDIEYSPLLREARPPQETKGKEYYSPEAIALRTELLTKWVEDESWHYSDEENLFDLKTRAHAALEYIREHEADDVLVVTHGTFLRMMIGVMMEGEKFSPALFVRFKSFLSMSNTGIAVCENSKSGWRLITWNDHAHLG